jgi:hypothetical protein
MFSIATSDTVIYMRLFSVVSSNVIYKHAYQMIPYTGKMNVVRFEVFTAVTMKNAVFWDMTPCRSCVNRRFGGTYHLHLQGRKIRERGTSVSRWLQSATCSRRFLARHQQYSPFCSRILNHWSPLSHSSLASSVLFYNSTTCKITHDVCDVFESEGSQEYTSIFQRLSYEYRVKGSYRNCFP